MVDCFTSDYVARLCAEDEETERHFVAYFSDLIKIKVRARCRIPQLADDVCQETFLRVFRILRSPGGLRHPERLGAFVHSVSNNVLLEALRARKRHPAVVGEPAETSDEVSPRADDFLIAEERQHEVRRILASLPARDQQVLRAVFLEEKERDEICAELGVERSHLRVLLHRAKAELRNGFLERRTGREVRPMVGGSGGASK